MSQKSRMIQSLIGTVRVPKFEQIPTLAQKSGFAFPPASMELYPTNHGVPTTPLGFTLKLGYNVFYQMENITWIRCPHCDKKYPSACMREDTAVSKFVCIDCWNER